MLKADAIIVVSNFIREYLLQNYQEKDRQFPFEKITVIQRGVDLNYFNHNKVSKNRIIDLIGKWGIPEDKKIILMPARFTFWKGHEFLIEALTKVKNDFFCVMVGSDHGHKKFRKKLEQKIIKENLAGKMKIVGICKDMPAAYAVAHFVVCPSVKPEAFGRISIEAQASNKIIIATKIGGALETVIDGKTGFLVEVGDTEKLAQLIDKVLEMPKSETDVMEKMCSKTISVYKSLLNPHPAL
jgi:glycosyltransferase involved in cell wall biosynthesis